MRISISWLEVTQWWLIYSRHFWLSACAYVHFMSDTITADMLPSLLSLRLCVFPSHKQHSHYWHVPATLILRECVYPFHEQHSHGWHVPGRFPLSASSSFHFISSTVITDMFPLLLILRECVFPFHEQLNHGWHVPVTVDSQWVRMSIPWAAQSWLTCSRHFWLSASTYVHFMSSTIMTDIFPPLSTISQSVFPFHK